MARIFKIGKTYYVDIVVNGRRIRRSLGVKNKAAAEAARGRLELTVAQGKSPFIDGDIRMEDLIDVYLAYCEARNTTKTVSLKRTYLGRFLEFAGNVGVRSIKRADVENYLSRRAKSGEYPAVNRELTTLKHFFNFGIQREIIEKNPAVGVKKLPEKRRPIRLLSERELDAYFDYCRKNDQLLYDLSVIAFHTGLRRGDILKIKGEDVDAERRMLTVVVSKRRGELTLTLPLNDTVHEVLARRSNDNGNDYLFPGRNVDHIVDFKRRFERAKKAIGVDFKFMEFRHNCATALLQSGVDIYTVKEILGHTSLTTTERYLKLVDERKRAALNKLDRKS